MRPRLAHLATAAFVALAPLSQAHAQLSRATLDLRRGELRRAEAAFQRATLERGINGWVSYFAEDGSQLLSNRQIVRGHRAIRDLMGDFLADRNRTLLWHPVVVEVGPRGDVGYTYGAAAVVTSDSVGQMTVSRQATFITVWRRDQREVWKVLADMGSTPTQEQLDEANDTTAVRVIDDLEARRRNAIQSGDRPALERIYAREFVGVTAAGDVVDRDRLLGVLARPSPNVTFTADAVQIHVTGETAIVTGRLTGTAGDGSIVSSSSFIHMYGRRGDRWELARARAVEPPRAR